MEETEIIIIGDDVLTNRLESQILGNAKIRINRVTNQVEAIKLIEEKTISTVILAKENPSNEMFQVIDELISMDLSIKVILVSEKGDLRTYLRAFSSGAHDCFFLPLETPHLLSAIEKKSKMIIN